MRILRFISLLFCLLFLHHAALADGGDVLEHTIRLSKMKGTVYALLGKVSEQSGCLFVYDSGLVNSNKEVKIKEGSRTVRRAIYDIIGDDSLELKVVGNHILIIRSATTNHKEGGIAPPVASANFTITGVLLDKQTGEAVTNATVFVRGTSIGSITNRNGEFKLLLPDSLRNAQVAFSHIGYVAQELKSSVLIGRNNMLSLEPKVVPLQEVLIRVVDPKKLLRKVMECRKRNYSDIPVYLTTFYREGVQLKNKFQSLTEAVFKVYKPSITSFAADQVKLLKMSKIDNREEKDSLNIRIVAGIRACLQLDIVKNIPDFLTLTMDNAPFVYTSGGITYMDGRCMNIVYFEQRREVTEPLLCGELYIDSENNSLLQARIEIQPRYVKKAASTFVARESQGVKLIPQKIAYTISYRPWNGIYYIHHIRGDLHFRVKRKGLFAGSSGFHSWFEMVTCKIDVDEVTPFPRAERLPTRTVFSDMDFKYDETFWADFNIIPLEQEISKIIEQVSLKIEKTGE